MPCGGLGRSNKEPGHNIALLSAFESTFEDMGGGGMDGIVCWRRCVQGEKVLSLKVEPSTLTCPSSQVGDCSLIAATLASSRKF